MIWNLFEEIKTISGKDSYAKCKPCEKEIQGLVALMKNHYSLCSLNTNEVDDH